MCVVNVVAGRGHFHATLRGYKTFIVRGFWHLERSVKKRSSSEGF